MKDFLIKLLIRLGWYKKPPVVIYTPPVSTVTKKNIYKPKRCPINHKISHTEQEAKDRARASGRYVQLRAYKCEFCPAWHMTHKKNKLTMH